MRRFLLLMVLAAIPARAADIYACYSGSSEQGGHKLTVNGSQTKQYAQQSFPLATVSVFTHGTQSLATIYTDGSGTQTLINPFTSTSNGVAFWCAPDGTYDVRYSGTSIVAPFTVSGIHLLFSGGGGGGGSGTVGPGTVGHLLKFTTPTTAGDTNCTDDGVTPIACSLGVSVTSTALFATKVNNPSVGTTVNLLVARDSAGRAINAQPTDTNNLIGIAAFGSGTSNSVTYAYSGNFACKFDNQTQINDWAVLGSSSQCHDAGATEPAGVQNMGRITSVNGGAGTLATIDMGLPDVNPAVNGGVGNCANAAGPITYYTLAQVTGCDPAMTTDGAGNLQAVSGTFSGSGSGFVAFGQGAAPSSLAANTVYLSSPASVVTSFNTALPATPGTAGQFLEIDTVPSGSQITTKWASAAGCPQGTCVINAPTGDQTITGSGGASNLINEDQGGFIAADTPNTDATLGVFMDAFNTGQGAIAYSKPSGPVSTSIRFNAPGAITLNPTASGADDAAHGVILNNSGLTIVGDYTDGYGLVMTAGNVLVQGGALATGNPLITLGSTGVEGVIKTVPASGGGSYLFRFPTTASNRSITAIDKSGNLVLSAAALGNSLGVCTDINGLLTTSGCSTGGSVTSVGLTVNSTSPSGIFTVTGSPVTTSGSLNFNLAGTSGGVPYFSSGTVLSSSGALTSNVLVKGGGAGAAPTNSLFTDNGTTATYTGTGGISAPTLTSTVAIGTAPLTVTSTTVVPNLNVSQLLGGTWAVPGTIGSTTANTGAFTDVTANDYTTNGTGTGAYTVAGSTSGTCTFTTQAVAATADFNCPVSVNGVSGVLASSPGAGIAHFAGGTQTVTSSPIVAADITASTITGSQIASSVALSGSPTTTTQAADDNSTKIATTAYVDRMKTRGIGFTIGDPSGSALTVATTTTAYVTVPFACTLSAYNLAIDAGTITVKFWKVATGTAIPTSGNSINTSGVSIASGTAIHSTTMSDFTTTTVSANDIMAMNVTAVATAKYVTATLQCDQ